MTLTSSSALAGSSQSPLGSALGLEHSRTVSASSQLLSVVPPRDARATLAVDEVANEVRALEQALCAAYATAARLQQALVAAQAEAGFAASVGHQVFASVSNTSVNISAAMSTCAKGHALLEHLARRHGIQPTQWGDGTKDPSTGFFETGAAALNVAA